MIDTSFRRGSRARVYPPLAARKLACLLLLSLAPLLLPGCGGGSRTTGVRDVSAHGARFSVPGGWRLTRTPTTVAAANGERADELVSVSVFELLRPYAPALWKRVVPELDRAAVELARQLAAAVRTSRTVRVAGGNARVYELSFKRQGRAVRERITFVLRARREYELLCRWRSSRGVPAACGTLVSSFRPA